MKRSKSTPPANRAERKLNRRKFLALTGAGVSAMALLPACSEKPKPAEEPKGSNAALSGAAKSDGPEVTDLRFGIIALTDCSPIVIAHEKGFFKKYGINSTVAKGASWAAIRDSLSNGDIQATHMLIGMPHRLDDGPARRAEEADGHPLAAQPQRPGDHAARPSSRARSPPIRRRSSRSSTQAKKPGDAA